MFLFYQRQPVVTERGPSRHGKFQRHHTIVTLLFIFVVDLAQRRPAGEFLTFLLLRQSSFTWSITVNVQHGGFHPSTTVPLGDANGVTERHVLQQQPLCLHVFTR